MFFAQRHGGPLRGFFEEMLGGKSFTKHFAGSIIIFDKKGKIFLAEAQRAQRGKFFTQRHEV